MTVKFKIPVAVQTKLRKGNSWWKINHQDIINHVLFNFMFFFWGEVLSQLHIFFLCVCAGTVTVHMTFRKIRRSAISSLEVSRAHGIRVIPH